MILSPTTPITETIARISTSGIGLFCSFKERNDIFRSCVKGLHLEWSEYNHAWYRNLNLEMNGNPLHRAAELAGCLINAGIICEIDNQVAEMVNNGSWEPEHKRWVQFNVNYLLRWKDAEDNLYHRALMLPEAAWDHNAKAVSVPAIYFSEVIGFAEEHDFQFTSKARDSIEQSKLAYQRMILPEAPAPKKKEKSKIDHLCDPNQFYDLPMRNLVTTTTLLAHQVPAVEKILPLRVGAFFMDMGTGKTRCAIELVTRRQQRISHVIWFCPVGLKLTIAAEIIKHTTGEAIHVFDGDTGREDIPDAFWYIVGIESMSSSDRVILAIHQLVDQDTFVIVDESSYIKGHASKRSMRIADLCACARYRLLLTGTPITQGVEDLYAQMRFLSPDILGYNSFYSFANNHLEYSDKFPGLILRTLDVGGLTDKISPYIYQVTKDECMDLPEKIYDQVYFGLTNEQSDAYRQAKDEILSGILEETPDYIIFQLFTALQQIVSGFWNRNGKEFIYLQHKRVETLQTVINSIPENEKIIIWCKFIESVHQIAKTLDGCALYYGDLTPKQRSDQLDHFRTSSRFLVATMSSGGHGLTLNEAHYHIFYENEFKYSHRIQAEDRSHRIGQTEHVTYIDIVSISGIDRRIQGAISKKEDVVKAFRAEIKKRKVIDL